MKRLMTNILDLPGVIVEDYKQIGATLILVSGKIRKQNIKMPSMQSI